MRIAITVGREHGSKTFKLISGPEVPIQEQQASIKKQRASKTGKFAEVQLFESPRIYKFEAEKTAGEKVK